MIKRIRFHPSQDFLCILSALGIRCRADAGNGGGPAMVVELDPETDAKLLAVWEELTDLRYNYVCSFPIQLILPGTEGGDNA